MNLWDLQSSREQVVYTKHVPFRDDLIERTIEQLSQVLSRMLLHQTSYAELETFVQHTYQKYTGIDGQLLKQLSSQDILNTLSTTGQVDKEKAYLIAVLLEAESMMTEDKENLQLKALDLYLEVALADSGIPDIDERVEKLAKDLAGFVLPPTTKFRLLDFELAQGHYARAENRLFDLRESLGLERVKAKGLEVYDHLTKLGNDELEKGGLSLDEVQSSMKDFLM